MKDRIKKLKRVAAKDIKGAPWNFRVHPAHQRDRLRASIEELGFFDPLDCRELPDGSLELIDGHLRQEFIEADIGPDTKVPVIVTDFTEEEAKKAMAIKDPMVGMAEANEELFDALLEDLNFDEADLREMSQELMDGLDPRPEQEAEPAGKRAGPDEMDLRPHEHYDYVIVLARSTQEWNRLADLLDLEPMQGRRGGIGHGRGYAASQLIEKIEKWKATKSSSPAATE